MNPYLILDLETSVKNRGEGAIGKFLASPFCRKNKVVATGYSPGDWISTIYHPDNPLTLHPPTLDTTLVGHNILFDLLYLIRDSKEWYDWLCNGGQVFDTMLAEYLLTGQIHTFPSLDDTCTKYGGVLKDDRIKEYWKNGVDTEDIPKEELLEYLEGDIRNTELTYLAQMEKIKSLGMGQLLAVHMGNLIATVEMTHNGSDFDSQFAYDRTIELEAEYSKIEKRLKMWMARSFHPDIEVKLGSGDQISLFLFGGSYTYKEKDSVLDEDGNEVLIKSGKNKGKVKTRLYEKTWETEGIGVPSDSVPSVKKVGFFQTNDDVLKKKALPYCNEFQRGMIEDILKLGKLRTEIKTFFKGYQEIVFSDGKIHTNYNHTTTKTGRLSSSNPNLQNVSKKSLIKKCFTSRFGDDGVILEGDLKQIEIVIQAFLSQDAQMMKDVWAGVDFHCKRLAYRYKESYEAVYHKVHVKEDPEYVKARDKAKVTSFRRSYGAGAPAIADVIESTLKEAKEIIKAEEELYPGAVLIQEEWIREVEMSRVATQSRTKKGYPRGHGFIISISGKRYRFFEEDLSKKAQDYLRVPTGFPSTKIKNYPIQGLAGEVLYIILYELFMQIKADDELRDKCLMVLTVHDSVVFDIHKGVLEKACVLIDKVMTDAPRLIKEKLGIDFNLPVGCDIEYGENWLNCKTKWKPKGD